MPTKYYKVHGGRLTFAEYWRMSPDAFTFLIAAGMKLFGGMSLDASIPRQDELFQVEYDAIPQDARKRLRKIRDTLEAAGFQLIFCHEIDVLESHRYGVGLAFLAPDGKSFATVNYVREGDIRKAEPSILTAFSDDTFGVTTVAKKQFKPHPDYLVDRHPGMPADELYEVHQANLDQWAEDEEKKPRRLTAETLPQVVLDVEQRFVDFHVDRGVFVPIPKNVVRRLREERERADEEDEE